MWLDPHLEENIENVLTFGGVGDPPNDCNCNKNWIHFLSKESTVTYMTAYGTCENNSGRKLYYDELLYSIDTQVFFV